ncbi:Aldo/keto reductase, partial [Ceratobasidium sp. AG-I]
MSSYTGPTRRVGDNVFPAIGFGAMGIGGLAYGGHVTSDNEARFQVLDHLLELGCTHWDTANVYGDSEQLIGDWFKRTGKRDQIFLASKFGFRMEGPCGTPEYAKECIETSLQRLGVDTIDLYYVHRIDTNTPIEITITALAEYVKAGKIRHIGLSQPSPATLRRAHKVHPVAAIQVEYSPFETVIEGKGHLLETARELGVQVVAYSPLGKGLFTGQITSHSDFRDSDLRKQIPKFSESNFPKILALIEKFKEIGKEHNASSGQVSLAFLLAQGDDIIPIPGSQRVKYIEENWSAARIELTPEDLKSLRQAVTEAQITGDQYPPALQAM